MDEFLKRGAILVAAFFISFITSYYLLLFATGFSTAGGSDAGIQATRSSFAGLFAFFIAIVVLSLLFQSMLKAKKPLEGKRL